MPAEQAHPGESDRETVDASRPAAAPHSDGPLPSGGALEVRRLREALESELFDRASDAVRIGRFAVLERLGAGGMGVVYAAYDADLDRKVAVKVLRHEGRESDRDQLVEEARALARLSHPGIVTVHEVGEHDGQVFLAMEYVDGCSLDQWIQRDTDGQLRPWREVVSVFARAGRGLAAAHAAGLVHRDFKPHNAMLGNDGAVKVLDFGLARAIPTAGDAVSVSMTGPHGRASGSSTVTGAIAGTPAYMSPEQLGGVRATARSDQFSFCVALFEALHGQRPFEGRTLEEIAFSVFEGQIRPVPTQSSVPGFIRAAIARGLSLDESDRFDSMDALLAALERDPTTRRRRTLAAVAVTASLAGGAALWPAPPAAEDPCAKASAALDDSWNAAVRTAARDGLLHADSPRAAATWDRVGPQLDAYAGAWRRANDDACREHAGYRESAVTFDRRSTCLRNRKAALSAAAELLAEATPELVDRAAATVAALPSIDGCSAGGIAGRSATLEDPKVRDAVANQRDRLARARVLQSAGRYAEAAAIAKGTEERAAALAFAPLIAEAAVVSGSIAMLIDTPDVAEDALGRAIVLAVEAGHDAAAVEAVAKRAFVRAELQRSAPRAADDEALADALLVRLDPQDLGLRWLVHNNLGVVRERSDDPVAAERRYADALEHARARSEAGRLDAVASLTNLAYAANGRGDPTTGEARAAEAVALAEAALGPRHPQLPMPLHALAEALRDQRRRADAQAVLLRSIEIHRGAGGGPPPPAIADMHMLATLLHQDGRDDEARSWANQATRLAETLLPPDHPLSTAVHRLRATLLADVSSAVP